MVGHNGDAHRQSSTGEEPSDLDTPIKDENEQPKRTKRKKASRACFHCQKAHLTCDDSRPCQRCIKRGLDDTCQDGVRKKAKYLQDVENERIQALQQHSKTRESASPHDKSNTHASSLAQAVDISHPDGTINLAAVSRPISGSDSNNMALFGDNLLFDYPPLSTYDFDSKAANLEYSMLSTMLGSAGTPGTDHIAESPDPFTFPSPSVNGLHRGMPSRQHTLTPDHNSVKSDSSWSHMPFAGAPAPANVPQPHSSTLSYSGYTSTNGQNSSQKPVTGFINSGSNTAATSPSSNLKSPALSHNAPVGQSKNTAAAGNTSATSTAQDQKQGQASNEKPQSVQNYVDPHGQRPTPVARRPFTTVRGDGVSVYKSITKPFSYTHGYHLLNTYLRSRFEKQDLLRIARAIVGYRPSFIALTKTLREEDLTFMEICFQRTLLEYEKFVGYSGTPTIIWRRTGQIELVGKEFCLLTGWSREQLLAKQTFIVELMDDSSVVEYFEKFSTHAFGDTSSVQTTCVLMTPARKAVPCAFCFTIKRDVFDIPMMIVGNFLPVL